MQPETTGEDFAEAILNTIPAADPQPDPATLALSNQPGAAGESVPFHALSGRTVGDMGFRYAPLFQPATR